MMKLFAVPFCLLFFLNPLMAEPGKIILSPDASYLLPDGTKIQVKESKTCGLQEAIDRADQDRLDLLVTGGDFQSKVYHCTETVVFPPMQGKVITIDSATINLDGFEDPAKPGLLFDSCMNVTFNCHGQVVYHQKGPAVQFSARNNLPVDDFVGPTMVASRFQFMGIAYVSTPVSFVGKDGGVSRENEEACCVLFETSKSITRCEFRFVELLGGNYGIKVKTPSDKGGFAYNRLDALFVHEQFHTCIAEGTKDGDELNSRIFANQWNLHAVPSLKAGGIDAHGHSSFWNLTVVNEKGSSQYGLQTHPTTNRSQFRLQHLDGEILGPVTPEKPGSNRFE